MKFENIGGLITFKDDKGVHRYLGYLFNFNGHGVFDPTLGKVEVTPEEIDKHNALLANAEIEGLDKNCQVGQGGSFYLTPSKPYKVTTFTGELVSDQIEISEKGFGITFKRNGKVFRGRLQKDADVFNFRRVK